MTRDEWLPRLRDIFEGRTVRWETNPVGDYDGRERTLEVFNADARDQRELLRQFRDVRSEVEAFVGGPVIVLFHTTKETSRLYAEISARDLEERGKAAGVAEDHLMAALQSVRHALIAAQAAAPTLPALLVAEEHLLRVLFDENEVAEYLASPGAKVYGR